jgi:hypothetical protein
MAVITNDAPNTTPYQPFMSRLWFGDKVDHRNRGTGLREPDAHPRKLTIQANPAATSTAPKTSRSRFPTTTPELTTATPSVNQTG